MFSTIIVAFREVLEVALILGVILAATKGQPGRNLWVWIGLAAGVLASVLVAFSAEMISSAAEGMGQELLNAAILLTASLMIGWTVLWMKKHGREMARRAKQLGADIKEGRLPLYSLAVVIALTVLREGSEIVLFTYGMAASGESLTAILAGVGIGILAGALVGALMYYGLIKISPRYVFSVTSWMLVLVAAGMASVAAGYLSQAGYFASLSTPLWDSSALLSEESVIGKALHALFGYSATPLGIQLVFYAVTLAMLATAMRWAGRNKPLPTPAYS